MRKLSPPLEVLAIETSDPAIANGADCDTDPARSITDVEVFPNYFAMDSMFGDLA